jgi:hypothetical protein
MFSGAIRETFPFSGGTIERKEKGELFGPFEKRKTRNSGNFY